MTPKEMQTNADALHLLLAVPGKDEINHSTLQETTIYKVAADVLIAGFKDSKTQLLNNTIIPARQKDLAKAIYKKPQWFWNHMTATMRFRNSDPKFLPDEKERHRRVEAILANPIVKEGLKKEKDMPGKLLFNEWVTKEEFENDWGKSLMKSWKSPTEEDSK